MHALLLFFLYAGSAEAQESSTAQCVQDHEQAQVLRAEGDLMGAQSKMLACSKEACPAVVRQDCTLWYTENLREIPSIVVSAQKNSEDVFVANVFVNDELLTAKLEGKERRLNPGRYSIRVEIEGFEPITREILLSKRQRSRSVEFLFVKDTEDVRDENSSESTKKPEPEPPTHRPIQKSTYVFTGGALLGVAVGATFASVGTSQHSRLQNECAPFCSDSKKSSVDTKLLVADIAFGLALGSAVGALLTYVLRPRVPIKTSLKSASSQTASLWFRPSATPKKASFFVGGSW